MADEYSKEGVRALASDGDQLIRHCDGEYPTSVEFQESEMRMHAEHLIFAKENRAMFPTRYPEIMGIFDQ